MSTGKPSKKKSARLPFSKPALTTLARVVPLCFCTGSAATRSGAGTRGGGAAAAAGKGADAVGEGAARATGAGICKASRSVRISCTIADACNRISRNSAAKATASASSSSLLPKTASMISRSRSGVQPDCPPAAGRATRRDRAAALEAASPPASPIRPKCGSVDRGSKRLRRCTRGDTCGKKKETSSWQTASANTHAIAARAPNL
mmetsp:Transcript_37132/g.96207  ORF Transcript_37132/g.96207 Transcript_37132/m.96207 type:complete len:205 (-) Transcript_37132:110-724(-)